MTTQVTKTRSTIVKSVAAAVLLAACTTNIFAGTLKTEIATLGKNASAEIISDFTVKAEVERESLMTFVDSKSSAVNKQNFAKLGNAAINSINKEVVHSTRYAAVQNLNAALDAAPYSKEVMVVYANAEVDSGNRANNVSLLPSVASFTIELEDEFSKVFDRIVLDTLTIALNGDLNFNGQNTIRHIE